MDRQAAVRFGEELATAAKRLAAVVYPMGSGMFRHGTARSGGARSGMGHLAGGRLATVGLPVGAVWLDWVRRGSARLGRARFAGAWFGRVRSGMARWGLVRSCYAAYRWFTEPSMRCVSIVWCGKPRFAMVRSGMLWRGQVRYGAAMQRSTD